MSEVYSGYRWKRQTEEHLQDPKFLERYGYKVYSQNDEKRRMRAAWMGKFLQLPVKKRAS